MLFGILIIILCIFMIKWGQCCKDTTWPKDTEAAVGSDVLFYCSSSSECPTEWHHVPISASSAEISHKDGSCLNGYCNRYSVVSNTPGEYSLLIRNVSSDDAGTHRCVLANGQRGAELNIIVMYPSEKTCSAKIPEDGAIGHNQCQLEPDLITLACSLRYVGNVKAFLEWTQTSGNDVKFKIENRTSSSGTITSTLTFRNVHLREATFLCSIKHLNSNLTSPFNHSFLIKTVPLRQRNSTVDSDLHLIGCASDLPYKCSYSWKHIGNEVSSSQRLNLTGRTNGTYICHSTCFVRGRWCTFLAEQLTYQHSESASSDAVLIVAVIIVLVVICATVVTVCFLLKRMKKACFSTTPVIGDQLEAEKVDSPTDNLVPQLDQKKGGEGDKLLNGDGDEEPNGRSSHCEIPDDLSQIRSASCNIKFRNANIHTTEIGNVAGNEEATDKDSYTDAAHSEPVV